MKAARAMPTSRFIMQPNLSRLLRRAARAHENGDVRQADRFYNAVLALDRGNFDALHGLGQLYCRQARLDAALVHFQSALKSDCTRVEGFASLGLAFHLLRRFNEAIASYDAGLCLSPGDATLLNRRGVAWLELGQPDEALGDFECVLAGNAGHLDALGNYGNALLKLNRVADALAAYDRALAVAPENVQLLTNRAVALRRLDRPREAIMSTSRALATNPDFVQARFVDSVARLTLGDFAAGWRSYEARWSVGLLASQGRNFTAPLWLGEEPLNGKTILLHAEQGSGDTIQFVRFAPLVAGLGAKKVILEAQRELVRLFAGLPGVDAVIARGDSLPGFDLHCPLLSLPLAFETDLTNIPADIPYIVPRNKDVAVWSGRLPKRSPLVGVVWSGGRSHDNDLNRSLALASLEPLISVPGVCFVSLQHDVREADLPSLRQHTNLHCMEEKFRDFADTAAVISNLDAVIAVDTSVAHLAGAMGKPLFLLLPFAADFRWLRERGDSPWYPTARLYRQHAFGDWHGAIGALARDMQHFLFSAQRLSA